jgi:hypothetical protein
MSTFSCVYVDMFSCLFVFSYFEPRRRAFPFCLFLTTGLFRPHDRPKFNKAMRPAWNEKNDIDPDVSSRWGSEYGALGAGESAKEESSDYTTNTENKLYVRMRRA